MIDISPGMVEGSRRKAPTYEGALDACVMDVQALGFPDAIFDTIARAATVYSESALLARGPLDWEGNVR